MAHDRQLVAATEVAEFVEHAVVGQVVLGIAGHDLPAKQERGGVARQLVGGVVGPGNRHTRDSVRPFEVADDDPEFAKTSCGESSRKALDQRGRCIDEGLTQDQVFRRVTGQHQLWKRDDVSPARGRVLRPGHNEFGVALEVADDGVDLRQGESELRHITSVVGRSGTRRSARRNTEVT